MTNSIIGPIKTRFSVERAVLEYISQWYSTYLAEVERQSGLSEMTIDRCPAPDIQPIDPNFETSEEPQSIIGGIDAFSFYVGMCPSIIVNVKPVGDPEYQSDPYSVCFNITISAIIEEESEDRARYVADFYGAAIMACMVQSGNLDEFGTRLRMTQYPVTDFVDTEDKRKLAMSVSQYDLWVDEIVYESLGPGTYSLLTEPTEYPIDSYNPVTNIELQTETYGSDITVDSEFESS
jgi:hypothetical protein